jgi:hypothetical protein
MKVAASFFIGGGAIQFQSLPEASITIAVCFAVLVQFEVNAESVRQFQPGVCFETLGLRFMFVFFATLKGVATGFRLSRRNPFRVCVI